MKRLSFAALVATLLILPAIGSARAQTGCEPGDREVRSLAFEGNQAFTDRELATKIVTTASSLSRRLTNGVFGEKRCLEPQELRADQLRLQTFYRERGFYDAKIDTLVQPLDPTSVRVVFRIDEGTPIRIDSLQIGGLDAVTPEARRAVLGAIPIRQGDRFDKARIEAALDSVRVKLWDNGYPRADATRGYSVDNATHRATVELEAIPGHLAHISSVRVQVTPVEGREQQIPNQAVRRLSGLHRGMLYRESDLVTAQRNLYQTSAYRHVEVRIAPDSLQPKGDSLLVILVNLNEDLTKQIDTEVGWNTLDCFRTRAVYTDRNFLNGARRLQATGQLSKLGWGWPTEGARSLCRRQDIRPDSIFSDTVQYYAGITLQQPLAFGSRFTPAFSLYTERRGEYRAYLRRTLIGGEISASRDVGAGMPLRLGYTLEYGNTQAEPVVLCTLFNRCTTEEQDELTKTPKPLAIASVNLARMRTDNAIAPTSGNAQRIELRTSQPWLGSRATTVFSKGLVDGIWYHPMGKSGNVLSLRLRLGTVLGQRLTFGDSVPYVPPQERLYAGGATSVRGFQQNELGGVVYIAKELETVTVGDSTYPKARNGEVDRVIPTGGNSLVVINFDYRIRSPFLPQLLQYSLFTDMGQVWTRGASQEYLGFKFLKVTPGVGVRVFTPVGPFQVNVAYNPYVRPDGPIFYTTTALPDPNDPTKTLPPQLYCVSPSSDQRFGGANARPIVGGVQVAGGCEASFHPVQQSAFINKLTFTFSIGPEF